MEDPFFVVKDEVLKALEKTNNLFEQWKLIQRDLGELHSSEEREWSSTELKNSIRSIEWDLEDLEDTVRIVEQNPTKFRIDETEIASRRKFINKMNKEIADMKVSLEKENDLQIIGHDNADCTSDDFSPSAQILQQKQLGDISNSVSGIRDISRDIGQELDEQANMLDEFGTEVENAESKLDATMRKMSKVLHMTSDRRKYFAIASLSSLALILLILILAL